MLRYVCLDCGSIYDPRRGDPGQGVAPGTQGKDLPEAWACPNCGAPQSHFAMAEEDEDEA